MKGYTFMYKDTKYEIISEPQVIRMATVDMPENIIVFVRNCENGHTKQFDTDFIEGPIDKVK